MEYAHSWLYFARVAGVIALLRIEMACLVGSSLASGRRCGMAATAEVTAGAGFNVPPATLRISVLVRAVPAAAHALLLAGARYLRTRARFDPGIDTQTRSAAATFRNRFLRASLTPRPTCSCWRCSRVTCGRNAGPRESRPQAGGESSPSPSCCVRPESGTAAPARWTRCCWVSRSSP